MTADELIRLRRRLGLSQKALADVVGVTWNTVARWERDEMEMQPAMDKLIRLSTGGLKPIPHKRRFNAGRGGHAPGHLRDWFDTYVETGELDDEMTEKGLTIEWLCGQLWNCSDTLPSIVYNELDLRSTANTYAAAAREIKNRMTKR